MAFVKATKQQARARLALIGPPGSGKTYTALAIATRLGGRVAVIDTEHGSASKYAGLFDFDCCSLDSFAPQRYIDELKNVGPGGYGVVVIDSLSHAWVGKDGALEQVNAIAKRSQTSNTFAAWREVTPYHNALIEAILACPAHVIVTLRTKVDYVVEENDRGRKAPRKVGLAPIQRDGLEYEFDVVCDLNESNELIVGKTRCPALKDKVYKQAGEEVASVLRNWLSDGESVATVTEVLRGRMATARTKEELDRVSASARDAKAGGQITADEYQELGKSYGVRAKEIAA